MPPRTGPEPDLAEATHQPTAWSGRSSAALLVDQARPSGLLVNRRPSSHVPSVFVPLLASGGQSSIVSSATDPQFDEGCSDGQAPDVDGFVRNKSCAGPVAPSRGSPCPCWPTIHGASAPRHPATSHRRRPPGVVVWDHVLSRRAAARATNVAGFPTIAGSSWPLRSAPERCRRRARPGLSTEWWRTGRRVAALSGRCPRGARIAGCRCPASLTALDSLPRAVRRRLGRRHPTEDPLPRSCALRHRTSAKADGGPSWNHQAKEEIAMMVPGRVPLSCR